MTTSFATAYEDTTLLADPPQSKWRAGSTLTVLFGVSVLCQMDRILPFILAEPIKRDLGLSDSQLGLMTGMAFAVCNSLMSLPLARLADRGPLRMVLVGCVLAWSVMTALGGFAASFLQLSAARLGAALGEAGAIPGGHVLIARTIKPERRGSAIGIFSMGIPLGTMVGFAAGGRISDMSGWRATFWGAGAVGIVLAVLVALVAGGARNAQRTSSSDEPFLQSGLRLLRAPAFRWLFIGAILVGFASAPFYAFATSFLIRTYGYSTSQAGLAFGLLQGLMGIVGTLIGGRGFDRANRSGKRQLLSQPAWLFLIASLTTGAALFAPFGWLSVLLLIPSMLSFAFMLPWAFGTVHLVAGPGKQALASSLVLTGSSLLGPALGPYIVGLISDTATASQIPNGLRLGMLFAPFASALTGLSLLVANRMLRRANLFAPQSM